MAGMKKGIWWRNLDWASMWPSLFTLFCLMVFVTPVCLSVYIGTDTTVEYWIGNYINLVLVIPLVYLITHVVHVKRRQPVKFLVVICLPVASVFVLLLCDFVLLASYERGNQMAASDCDTFTKKKELETQWQMAKTYYANCAKKKADKEGISFAAATTLYRIPDCPDYEKEKKKNAHNGWEYLEHLETHQACAGWCTRGQPLWTFKDVKDSCSSVVADVMHNKVQRFMLQVVMYSVVVLGFTSLGLVAVGPVLRKHGVPW